MQLPNTLQRDAELHVLMQGLAEAIDAWRIEDALRGRAGYFLTDDVFQAAKAYVSAIERKDPMNA